MDPLLRACFLWVLCTEQGGHAMDKSCPCMLPGAGGCKLGAVHGAGKPCKGQILPMHAPWSRRGQIWCCAWCRDAKQRMNPAHGRSLGQESTNRVLCTEQGSHAKCKSCARSQLQVHLARAMARLSGAAACSALAMVRPALLVPLPAVPAPAVCHGCSGTACVAPGPCSPPPRHRAAARLTARPEQEPYHSALVETWKTICR